MAIIGNEVASNKADASLDFQRGGIYAMSKATGLTPVVDAEEIHRRSQLTPAEVKMEMRAEKKAATTAFECREGEEKERVMQIKKPWLYETQNPVEEPPDINYRKLIIDDQEEIDILLKVDQIHYSQRYLEYQRQDLRVERDLLNEYGGWIRRMGTKAKESGEGTRANFFNELQSALRDDMAEVQHECERQGHLTSERDRWLSENKKLQPGFFRCFCSGCAQDKQKVRHEELERVERLAGKVDFRNGIRGCRCDGCTPRRESASARHIEMEIEAELKGKDFIPKKGVLPGCDCNDCEGVRVRRATHKELKHLQRVLGNNDFRQGVPGCVCLGCVHALFKGYEEAHNVRHEKRLEEMKLEESLRGNTDIIDVIPGCDCENCCDAERRAVELRHKLRHKELKRLAWLRGVRDVENGLAECPCDRCKWRTEKSIYYWIVGNDSSDDDDALSQTGMEDLPGKSEDNAPGQSATPIMDQANDECVVEEASASTSAPTQPASSDLKQNPIQAIASFPPIPTKKSRPSRIPRPITKHPNSEL